MAARRRYGQHNQYWHGRMVRNVDRPDWLRLVHLCWSRQAANGHAHFGYGEIARKVEVVDKKDGTLNPNPNPKRMIQAAIEYGYLSPLSNDRCLVVVAGSVTGGWGDPDAVCDRHSGGR